MASRWNGFLARIEPSARLGRCAHAFRACGRPEFRTRTGCLTKSRRVRGGLGDDGLPGRTIRRPLLYFHDIGSTNDEAGRLAEAGAPEGTTAIAAGPARRTRPLRPDVVFPTWSWTLCVGRHPRSPRRAVHHPGRRGCDRRGRSAHSPAFPPRSSGPTTSSLTPGSAAAASSPVSLLKHEWR